MDSRIVFFDLKAHSQVYLAKLGVTREEMCRNPHEKDPSVDVNVSYSTQISLRQAALADELNELVAAFKLEILSLSPIREGIQVWARTPMYRRFLYNWRRLYQRQVTGDLCPQCLADILYGQETCGECGASLVWLTGGAISRP